MPANTHAHPILSRTCVFLLFDCYVNQDAASDFLIVTGGFANARYVISLALQSFLRVVCLSDPSKICACMHVRTFLCLFFCVSRKPNILMHACMHEWMHFFFFFPFRFVLFVVISTGGCYKNA